MPSRFCMCKDIMTIDILLQKEKNLPSAAVNISLQLCEKVVYWMEPCQPKHFVMIQQVFQQRGFYGSRIVTRHAKRDLIGSP